LTCSPDSFEPDDFKEQATPLLLGKGQTHDLCEDKHDWFSLELTGGTEYRFLLEHSLAMPVEVDLFDAAGSQLAESLRDGSSWVAPSGGSYLLMARSELGTTYDPRGSDGEYTLTLLPAVADLAATKLDPWAGLHVGGQSPVDVEVTNVGGADASGFAISLHLSPGAHGTRAGP
jgi:hypothetical protein